VAKPPLLISLHSTVSNGGLLWGPALDAPIPRRVLLVVRRREPAILAWPLRSAGATWHAAIGASTM